MTLSYLDTTFISLEIKHKLPTFVLSNALLAYLKQVNDVKKFREEIKKFLIDKEYYSVRDCL